jgi:hypothetical protein
MTRPLDLLLDPSKLTSYCMDLSGEKTNFVNEPEKKEFRFLIPLPKMEPTPSISEHIKILKTGKYIIMLYPRK